MDGFTEAHFGLLHYDKFTIQNPFHKGVLIIIGCTSTQVCGTCTGWALLQHHWSTWASLPSHSSTHMQKFLHGKATLSKPKGNPIHYSGHTFYTAVAVGLTQKPKYLSQWRNQMYHTYMYNTLQISAKFLSFGNPPWSMTIEHTYHLAGLNCLSCVIAIHFIMQIWHKRRIVDNGNLNVSCFWHPTFMHLHFTYHVTSASPVCQPGRHPPHLTPTITTKVH